MTHACGAFAARRSMYLQLMRKSFMLRPIWGLGMDTAILQTVGQAAEMAALDWRIVAKPMRATFFIEVFDGCAPP